MEGARSVARRASRDILRKKEKQKRKRRRGRERPGRQRRSPRWWVEQLLLFRLEGGRKVEEKPQLLLDASSFRSCFRARASGSLDRCWCYAFEIVARLSGCATWIGKGKRECPSTNWIFVVPHDRRSSQTVLHKKKLDQLCFPFSFFFSFSVVLFLSPLSRARERHSPLSPLSREQASTGLVRGEKRERERRKQKNDVRSPAPAIKSSPKFFFLSLFEDSLSAPAFASSKTAARCTSTTSRSSERRGSR